MSFWSTGKVTLRWLPSYLWQRAVRRAPKGRVHLLICLADHFEPSVIPGTNGLHEESGVQERRMERWCQEYPKLVRDWPDSDGQTFRHTYFFPAEQIQDSVLVRLIAHCHEGWGEIEIHLHHGADGPDTAENTRRLLVRFRDYLAQRGCLSRMNGEGPARYAFVHGNFALANSGNGQRCGVDNEMQILAETGCFADFTLPSAPNVSQTAKINSLYECGLPLHHRAPHRQGRDLEAGRAPAVFPLIVQGPLVMDWWRRRGRWHIPGFENGDLATRRPPNVDRLRLWRRVPIGVRGRPDWLFVKLYCHGMDPRDEGAMLGEPMRQFLADLVAGCREGRYQLHFVTAREMVNIALAACDGREGNPGDYRDYRLRLIRTAQVDRQEHASRSLRSGNTDQEADGEQVERLAERAGRI